MLGKGYSPVDYTLLCYGGGGPLHVAGYTAGVPYRDVLVPAWAAGFSAFGCACGDFAYRYDMTIDMPIEPGADDDDEGRASAMYVDGGWQMLRERVAEEFAKSGVAAGGDRVPPLRADAVLRAAERPRDLLASPVARGGRAGRRPDRCLRGGVRQALCALGPLARARLPDHERDRDRRPARSRSRRCRTSPRSAASRRRRAAARSGGRDGWADTPIYEQDDVRAGQSVAGPAVIESPADTFAVPPGRRARLDGHRHLPPRDSSK